MLRGERGERLPQDWFERGLFGVDFCPKRVERAAHVSFAKAERAKRKEGLFIGCGGARLDDSAIRLAICMTKRQSARHTPGNHQVAAVQGTVVSATDGDEILRAVTAAFGAKGNMM
jgi:hypothetical protein